MTFTAGRMLNLASAISGAAGTITLFNGSFSYATLGVWANEELIRKTSNANRRRQILQRIGLALITLSFVLQGVAQFFD